MAWFVAQTIKFVVRLTNKNVPVELKRFIWTYIWASGAPSAHAATLISSLYLVWFFYGFSAISAFCLIVTLVFLYNLATDRKRQETLDQYYETSGTKIFKRIVKEGVLLDLAGHTVREILWGAVVGIIVAVVSTRFITW